jgi:hypothetical protein
MAYFTRQHIIQKKKNKHFMILIGMADSTDHLLHHKRAMAKTKTKMARQRPNQRASSQMNSAMQNQANKLWPPGIEPGTLGPFCSALATWTLFISCIQCTRNPI